MRNYRFLRKILRKVGEVRLLLHILFILNKYVLGTYLVNMYVNSSPLLANESDYSLGPFVRDAATYLC